MANNIQDLRQTLKAAKQDLWKRPNVVATGIGYKISNGIDADIVRTQFPGEAAGQADNTGLGDAVNTDTDTACGGYATERGDVDNIALLTCNHVTANRLTAEVTALEVDIDNVVPFVFGSFEH